VHSVGKGWCGHQDQLQCPEPDVRDGEVEIVADILAAGLLCVAGEGGLLITPDTLSSHHQHHDAEDEHHGEPDAANGSGMAVHSNDQGIEAFPLHGASDLKGK
uniref:Uncharacterized protein n=1 Tax=Laticauda laticaudata TaxID=8630 RepID=A0A8C5RKN3_LATLA